MTASFGSVPSTNHEIAGSIPDIYMILKVKLVWNGVHLERNDNHIIPSYSHPPVGCRSLVDRYGSIRSCNPPIYYNYCLFNINSCKSCLKCIFCTPVLPYYSYLTILKWYWYKSLLLLLTCVAPLRAVSHRLNLILIKLLLLLYYTIITIIIILPQLI